MSIESTQAYAPGRVNLIGEHTDYSGGLALPFAIHAGVTVSARRIAGKEVQAVALDLDERDAFSLWAPERASGWRAFVRGAVAELRGAGIEVPAARVEISGDLPRGSGLSSSAALALALCLALIDLSGAPVPAQLWLARLAQRIEHDWYGANTGLLDQLASLGGKPGHALLIDFQTLETSPVPIELSGHRIVVMGSGGEHANAASGYNTRREECAEAARRMNLESLRGATIQDLHMLPEVLARRAHHVITENGRVLQAVAALERRDLTRLGEILDSSHASLRDCFEVSTAAVEECVSRLKAAGALGARLVGGGFGGSVLALMPPGAPVPSGAMCVAPGPGAHLRQSV